MSTIFIGRIRIFTVILEYHEMHTEPKNTYLICHKHEGQTQLKTIFIATFPTSSEFDATPNYLQNH